MKHDNDNKHTVHATIDELLSFKSDDSESHLSEAKAKHIETCVDCKNELSSLSQVGRILFDHVDEQPRDEVWQKLQLALYGEKVSSHAYPETQAKQIDVPQSPWVHSLRAVGHQSLSKAIYALAASVAFVGVVAVFMFSQHLSNSRQTQLMQASINELMKNSRSLEQSLQTVVSQNRALSDANQRVAERLYWKLSYVDQLIHEVMPEDSERIMSLWNDRVEALNELQQIYFEHNNVRNTSEI